MKKLTIKEKITFLEELDSVITFCDNRANEYNSEADYYIYGEDENGNRVKKAVVEEYEQNRYEYFMAKATALKSIVDALNDLA